MLSRQIMLVLVLVVGAAAGCTERVNVCNSDSDCTDPAYPFCDVNGEYAESGHVAMSCSVTPASCPVERCGCVAGLVTCNGDQLATCNADGNAITTETCPLGCATDSARCSTFEPSNGLSAQLEASASEPDRTLPDGAVIDTTTGMVTGAAGTIPSVTVAQSGGADIRVFIARSWTISNVRVVGSLPVAFVAANEISVTGTIDASADGSTAGPGASSCESGGNGGTRQMGFFERPRATDSAGYPTFIYTVNGGGGGGFGTAGGNGGFVQTGVAVGAGGEPNGPASLSPLRGGCDGFGDFASLKGAGGGAIQLVGGRRVHLVKAGTAAGVLHVGGGGGRAGVLGTDTTPSTTPIFGSGGGGSGGGILLEAPSVVLDDNAALLAAGGGGGGYGACANAPDGHDAPQTATLPSGGACPAGTIPTASGGAGATTGLAGDGSDAERGGAGSGGGGSGRVRVNTADGTLTAGAGATIWGALTTGTLERR